MGATLEAHDFHTFPDAASVVAEWWRDHGNEGDFPTALMPPSAVVVTADGEPVAFLACYWAVSAPVAWIDWPVTKPRTPLAIVRPALLLAADALERAAKTNGYGVAQVFTVPAIARALRQSGWNDAGQKLHLAKLL